MSNVREAVPFLRVTDMAASVRFYELLGFRIARRWEVADRLRWCRLESGGAGLMLQDFTTHDGRDLRPEGPLGQGVSIVFLCADALAIHDDVLAQGRPPEREPFVGNGLWVVSYVDPDGYRIDFESPTDVAEETRLSTSRA